MSLSRSLAWWLGPGQRRESTDLLNSTQVDEFSGALEEAVRADEAGVSRFIEPAAGTLRRALSNRHHLIFGRRGSGKTSLLRKTQAELIAERRPNAFIDMEKFKAHSYPDVLISVLIATFTSVSGWLGEGAVASANKRSYWAKLKPRRKPLPRSKSSELVTTLKSHIAELNALLYAEDGAQLDKIQRGETRVSNTSSVNAGINLDLVEVGATGSASGERSAVDEVRESARRSKVDFLHRRVLDYQSTLSNVVKVAGQDGFIMLDDLYYIRRASQPDVLDYFHRMFKGSGLWLKVGTIRHRSEWYRHGDPTVGMKLGDDVDDIDLDLTLEKYQTAKDFLQKVTSEIAGEHDLVLNELVNKGARDRLVLASGGVARDYLGILRRSIAIAREQGSEQINVAAVNQAATEYESTKRDEFRRDVIDGEDDLQKEFDALRNFCFSLGSNCFIIEKDLGGSQYHIIKELVDLRLVHAIRSRVTARQRPGRIFEAFMLDISQYVGERKRRNFEILEFWRSEEDKKLRRVGAIYAESER